MEYHQFDILLTLGNIEMKQLLIIVTVLLSMSCFSQNKDTIYLKGLPEYHTTKEQREQHDSLVFYESRVDSDRKVCLLFVDTANSKVYIFLEQENHINDSVWHTPLDMIEIETIPKGGTVVIGSREFYLDDNEDERLGFVISVECCYEDESDFYKSNEIIALWSNLNGQQSFTKLDPNLYVRYNEGFYKKK